MKIAVLALQGAFIEHRRMLERIGVETFEVRNPRDWSHPKDGLILPGGESTVQARLLHELDLFEPLRREAADGLPVFGTCAGLILLSTMHLGVMNIEVARNAYGRQSGSFRTTGPMEQVGDMVPMTFIRAPYIMHPTTPDVQVLARVDGRIVAARQHHLLVTAFHPELDDDLRIHRLFLDIVRHNSKQCPAQQQAMSGTTRSLKDGSMPCPLYDFTSYGRYYT